MRSRELNVNVLRQVRKALAEIRAEAKAGNVMKVFYMTYCLNDMVARGDQTWSMYQPMIEEEFE